MGQLNLPSNHVESCLARGEVLASRLALFSMDLGADAPTAERLRKIAARAFPVLLWTVDKREIGRDADALATFSVLGRFGIATWALGGHGIPERLRQKIFPLLRPDTHEIVVRWWDDVAIASWVESFFLALEAEGALNGLIAPDLRPGAYSDYPSEEAERAENLRRFVEAHGRPSLRELQ